MNPPRFDRQSLEFLSVEERDSKFAIESLAVDPASCVDVDAGPLAPLIDELADRIRRARDAGAPVAICHGAHLIKNGLGTVLIRMVGEGWLQHVATNGAGSIHDFEFATIGRSCEDVRAYVERGQFGIWDETGGGIGRALLVGALDGLGYGSAVGRMIVEGGVDIPDRAALEAIVQDPGEPARRRAAAADILDAYATSSIEPGPYRVANDWSRYSVQAACYRAGVPLTVHPGIGQDIIYTHPAFQGGAVGRTSVDDFLIYADTVRRLSGGVYLSVGSSVMSPMIFEKSVSMARNVARRDGSAFGDHFIAVNDLAESTWDWSKGEPPIDDPAYYVRFCKSFSRMGGELRYFGADNRVFLLALYARLSS